MMEKSSSASAKPKRDIRINIKDLRPQLSSFELIVIVVEMAPSSHITKKGINVRNCKVADKTGSVNFSAWGDHCNVIKPGDILLLTRCYTVIFKGSLTVYLSKEGIVRKLDELCMLFSRTPDMSVPNSEWLRQNYENKSKFCFPQKNQATGLPETQQDFPKRDKSDF